MKTILIVDDEEKLRNLLSRIITLEGFEVIQAGDCQAALKKIEHSNVDVVLCDVKLPDGNGVELTKTIKERFPTIEVILLTAYGNLPDGVQAIKNGAFDYIIKGDDNDRIVPLLYRAIEKVELSSRIKQLEKQLDSSHSFDTITGTSKTILQAIELAQKVAPADAAVLLTGETGTGKEVFARAIHQASGRRLKSFVAINCSAFGKDLLESEMFGHKAGSFTGATKEKKGLFEEANQGTIFLDEIGEMPAELQAKLLRVLESGEFIKVGDTKPIKVNVRIIAATHRDLQQEIKTGHFREDLFYRISAFQIKLPALRERLSDIEMLANHFAAVFSAKTNKLIKKLTPEFIEALKQHAWNGNIRELKNVIERSVILSSGDELAINTLPFEFHEPVATGKNGKVLSAFDLSSVEKLHIQKVLNYTNGNRTEAAKLLGIGAATLYRKIDEYKL
ncbi:MAG TPA: sigma-54 dependent transcriptional regulator [Chitinophagales bacterium]|nr:sigma-54 dependent transcriptional regulator [Chitinophagales bacterium]